MNHLSDTDRIQLVRYLTEESTPEERAEVERWSIEDPQWGHQFQQLRRSWEACGPDVLVYDQEALWASLERMIQADTESVPKYVAGPAVRGTGSLGTQPLRRRSWYTLAGAVVALLAIVAGWRVGTLYLGGHRSVAMAVYTTGNGQRANITLTDGTTVALGVASRLEVPADYPAGDRTVRLQGEAVVTVMHHTGIPFTVLVGSATARVMGTSFLVRNYATDRLTTVAVRDGKVSVQTAVQPPVVLTTAQQLMTDGVKAASVQPADWTQFSFATGTLVLHRRRLSDAIPELDRWYNADIRVNDTALQHQVVNGTLTAGSLSDLESILELSYDVHVMRNGRILTLSAR